MNVWTCAIRCDVRGCMAQVGGNLNAHTSLLALKHAWKDAREAGWHISEQDGTDEYKCPEHKPKE